MPKRSDIHSILIPGSGPIVIGQAAEFDYSGTQAVKALRAQGYRIILINSNPATVMTDPDLADATYIEPLLPDTLEAIIAQERPDAMLPTVGGQTGLNLALALSENGVLEKYGVRLIGATIDAIRIAEDRDLFRQTMLKAGLPVPQGGAVRSLAEAQEIALSAGYPLLLRASFALGGSGAGWVNCDEELPEAVRKALDESPIGQAWIEESIMGWKEYELEVMRDAANNFVVVCSIENLDPMGVHTGDSITLAPAQTLTDREYQVLRDLAQKVMAAVGVETGGANVQFAVDPLTGRALIIEMNPRVSRSSALASKATGFPIAKIAALVAAGYTLDEITNDITGQTVAAFEPALDYVVVKIPRWSFEKFPGVDTTLGPQMKSVGEVMALGSTFKAALMKAIQSLETGIDAPDGSGPAKLALMDAVGTLEETLRPTAGRLFNVYRALRSGVPAARIAEATGMDRWFLAQLLEIIYLEGQIRSQAVETLDEAFLRRVKRAGFCDAHLARLLSRPTAPLVAWDIRHLRLRLGVTPTFQRVDTCAAEFESQTPYLYSAYETEDEARPDEREKILILGGGPNRIGQGIEFDYCCCQAAFVLTAQGYEIIMLNCNPETVSTDYDTSGRLYFEPMTLEHVLNVIDREKPRGVILQLGGQTPLNLAEGLEQAGVRVLGTSPASIALAEDREKFAVLLDRLDIAHPEYGIVFSLEEAAKVASRIGYPVLVRPSFVLGGRAMAVVGDESQLAGFIGAALDAAPGQPVLVDRFMEDAYEIDVDALADGKQVVIGAIMQHIEEAGVHSGEYDKDVIHHDLEFASAEDLLSSKETLEDGDAVHIARIKFLPYNRVTIIGPVWRPGRYALTDGMRVADLIRAADSLRRTIFYERGTISRVLPDLRREILPFNLRLALAGDASQNHSLMNEDSVTVYAESLFTPERMVTVEGAVKHPGKYWRREKMTVADAIVFAGGLTEFGIVSGIEVARMDTVQVGKYATVSRVDLPADYWKGGGGDIELQDYDIVSIPENPKFSLPKSVVISGYVMSPGTYAIRYSGERMAELFRRAGGLRVGAYLEGSRLIRKFNNAGLVPLNFKSALEEESSRDNVVLYDGDSINVALTEDVVYVSGEVFVPSPVLYQKGAGLQFYLDQAGGTKDLADEDRTVVLLPGGKKWEEGGLFGSDDILPGSSIFVPKKLEKEDKTLPIIRDIATILASLAALTVAMVQVTK